MRPCLPLFLIALGLLAGCGEGSAPLPSKASAREALQTALDAWKAGKPPSSLAGAKPARWSQTSSRATLRMGLPTIAAISPS